MPDGVRQRWPEILQAIIDAWARVGLRVIEVSSSRGANIIISFVNGNGWIGLAQFNNQSCGDEVFCKLDIRYVDRAQTDDVKELGLHETGHNDNMPHTNGGIMNPFIVNGGVFVGWQRSDPSWNRIVAFHDGEPLDDVDPPPPPPPDGIVWGTMGSLQVPQDKSPGELILPVNGVDHAFYTFHSHRNVSGDFYHVFHK